jgi:SAM-dependent methyltransferase
VGRRGIRIQDADKWVFNRLAQAYRFRPGYPEPVVERVAALGGREAVDLGAGTGLLAIPLARRGFRVTAVEPAREMLAILEEGALAAGAEVRAVHASAEDTGLPASSFDLATLADSLQWVDPERTGEEIARLLRARGSLAIIEAEFADTPFMRAVRQAVRRRNPRGRRSAGEGALEHIFRLATGRSPEEDFRVRHDVPLGESALHQVVRSLSFVGPALGVEILEDVLVEIRAAAARCGGAVWAREIRVVIAQRRGVSA